MAKFTLSPEAQKSLKDIKCIQLKTLEPREQKFTFRASMIDFMS